MIDGTIHQFEFRGLYDGVSILSDRETGSYWHHITGECMYGPLKGKRLGGAANLLHMSAEQAIEAYPEVQVAVSDRPISGRQSRFWPFAENVPALPQRFRDTMAGEDTRRPTLDVGLGVWTGESQRFYPMEFVAEAGNAIIDEFDGRKLLVYFDPTGLALAAFYTNAMSVAWDGDDLRLNTGEVLRLGTLRGAGGERLAMERPLQLFTRWYGFALTFPDTEVYRQ